MLILKKLLTRQKKSGIIVIEKGKTHTVMPENSLFYNSRPSARGAAIVLLSGT